MAVATRVQAEPRQARRIWRRWGARPLLSTCILFTCFSPFSLFFFFFGACVHVCEIVSNVTLHYQGYNESLLKWI